MLSQVEVEESTQNHYMALMNKVGNDGLYQWVIYGIVLMCWLFSGILTFSVPFLYLNTELDCSSFGISQMQCQKYICEHFPTTETAKFLKEDTIKSLATQFGFYHCEQGYLLGLLRASMFVGSVIGIVFFMFYEEKIGNRKMYIVCLAALISGSLLLVMSQSMTMATLAQLLLGFGYIPSIRFGIALISDITKPELSQRFIATLDLAYAVGCIIVSLAYEWLKDWRYVTFYLISIPYSLLFICTLAFLQDCPRYLLKQCTLDEAQESLNFIARVNGCQQELEKEEVRMSMEAQKKIQQKKKNMNPIDVFRFPSIKKASVTFCVLTLFMDLLYMAHSVIVDEIGFNPSLNQVLMSGSEIVSAILAIIVIPFIRRKRAGQFFGVVGVLSSLALIWIQVPSNCEECPLKMIQVGLVMVARFSIIFQFSVLLVALGEFYPTSVKAIGIAVTAIFGMIGIIISQVLLTTTKEMGINPFLVIGIAFGCVIVVNHWTPETYGLEPQDQVEQMR